MAAAPSGGWANYFAAWIVSDEPNEAGEWRAWCPLHQDPETSNTPAAAINLRKGVWKCFGKQDGTEPCNGGTLTELWHRVDEQHTASPAPARPKRSGKPPGAPAQPVQLPTDEDLLAWHKYLMGRADLRKIMLEERGLSRAAMLHFKIGYHPQRRRFTIPVYTLDNKLANVRMYDPHPSGSMQKMYSWASGTGSARLFLPYVAQRNQTLIVLEGEMDTLCGQSHGLRNVLSHTGGSKVWKHEWSELFADKDVFLCYDLDAAGEQGMNKALDSLRLTASAVFFLRLPMDKVGSDLTDWFVQGHTKQELLDILEATRAAGPVWQRGEDVVVLPTPKPVTLIDSQDSSYGDHPLEIVAHIAGKQHPAYLVPRRVEYACDRSWGERCITCPMQARGGTHSVTVAPHDAQLLRFIGVNETTSRRQLHELAGAPVTCPRLVSDEAEKYSVEELVLQPRASEGGIPINRRALNVGRHDTPINTVARIVARNLHDPKDRHAILLSFECEPAQTDIDKFRVTPDISEQLKVFQPEPGESPLDKMEDIAEDLATNVTGIYGRPELHVAYDAVWHSVLDFSFCGAPLGKGWLELCVIGDSRTGKTEAATKLAEHYSSGVVQSCEGMSFAGLIGGVQQMGGNHWMITWGVVPLNDRRLVVLDEFSGIVDKNIIEQMSSVRSSGKAQITKIQTDETSARTRLIWIANPLDGKAMAELHQPGISALQTLIAKPEDIARFDLATACAKADVDPALINSITHEPVPHVYTKELCSLLVQWVWSRKAHHVVWRNGVEAALVDRAAELGRRYVPEPPLIQFENVRVKLARIAVAIAARTYSTDNQTGTCIVVGMRHVESAVALLDRLYGMKSFAYMSASRRLLNAQQKAVQQNAKARKYLKLERDGVTATLLSVRNNVGFKIQDFSVFGNMDRAEAQVAVKELTRMGMIRSISHGKIKIEPPLMELLQEIEEAEEQQQ